MIWKRFFPLVCYLILATTYSCEEYSDNMNNCWTRTRLEMCYDLVFQFFEEMLIPTYGFIKHPAYVSPEVLLALLFPGCWGKTSKNHMVLMEGQEIATGNICRFLLLCHCFLKHIRRKPSYHFMEQDKCVVLPYLAYLVLPYSALVAP